MRQSINDKDNDNDNKETRYTKTESKRANSGEEKNDQKDNKLKRTSRSEGKDKGKRISRKSVKKVVEDKPPKQMRKPRSKIEVERESEGKKDEKENVLKSDVSKEIIDNSQDPGRKAKKIENAPKKSTTAMQKNQGAKPKGKIDTQKTVKKVESRKETVKNKNEIIQVRKGYARAITRSKIEKEKVKNSSEKAERQPDSVKENSEKQISRTQTSKSVVEARNEKQIKSTNEEDESRIGPTKVVCQKNSGSPKIENYSEQAGGQTDSVKENSAKRIRTQTSKSVVEASNERQTKNKNEENESKIEPAKAVCQKDISSPKNEKYSEQVERQKDSVKENSDKKISETQTRKSIVEASNEQQTKNKNEENESRIGPAKARSQKGNSSLKTCMQQEEKVAEPPGKLVKIPSPIRHSIKSQIRAIRRESKVTSIGKGGKKAFENTLVSLAKMITLKSKREAPTNVSTNSLTSDSTGATESLKVTEQEVPATQLRKDVVQLEQTEESIVKIPQPSMQRTAGSDKNVAEKRISGTNPVKSLSRKEKNANSLVNSGKGMNIMEPKADHRKQHTRSKSDNPGKVEDIRTYLPHDTFEFIYGSDAFSLFLSDSSFAEELTGSEDCSASDVEGFFVARENPIVNRIAYRVPSNARSCPDLGRATAA